jgi:DNA-binding response OmpR family regulator
MIDVYYIEDDNNIAQIVKEYLDKRGFKVSLYSTIESAKEAIQSHMPGLVLVDWNMPDGEGYTLCQWIRSQCDMTPIIFLTVRNDTRDIVFGFNKGADDYVVKPFELEVLYSRICALLRRTENVTNRQLSCDMITIDQSRMMVFYKQKEIAVSQMEYQLLLILMLNKGKTVTRERLMEEIWECNGNYVNDNTLTVTMKRLREKLHQPSCLKTIRSFGYRMEDTIC